MQRKKQRKIKKNAMPPAAFSSLRLSKVYLCGVFLFCWLPF
jgi:hypothetical protein